MDNLDALFSRIDRLIHFDPGWKTCKEDQLTLLSFIMSCYDPLLIHPPHAPLPLPVPYLGFDGEVVLRWNLNSYIINVHFTMKETVVNGYAIFSTNGDFEEKLGPFDWRSVCETIGVCVYF